MMWEKFSNNNFGSKASFVPNKNDLMDSLILFSIVPENKIVLVTDEKMLHKVFEEIGMRDSVYTLDDYLKSIGFIN